jgi:hypothetical protein
MIAYKFDIRGFFLGEVEVTGNGIPPHHAFEAPPEVNSGEVAKMTKDGWVVVEDTRKVVSMSKAEVIETNFTTSSEVVREQRNQKLADTDWIVVKAYETGTNISSEWEIYRQALRDITAHTNWPNLADADWPTKP